MKILGLTLFATLLFVTGTANAAVETSATCSSAGGAFGGSDFDFTVPFATCSSVGEERDSIATARSSASASANLQTGQLRGASTSEAIGDLLPAIANTSSKIRDEITILGLTSPTTVTLTMHIGGFFGASSTGNALSNLNMSGQLWDLSENLAEARVSWLSQDRSALVTPRTIGESSVSTLSNAPSDISVVLSLPFEVSPLAPSFEFHATLRTRASAGGGSALCPSAF